MTTPYFAEPARPLQSYKIEVERIVYHHLIPAPAPPPGGWSGWPVMGGGWSYHRETLGTVLIDAQSLDAAEREALRRFPLANSLRVFNKPLAGAAWELIASSTWPTMAHARPYAERHPKTKTATLPPPRKL